MVRKEQNGSSSAAAVRRKKQISSPSVAEMLESIVGCKWSLAVLDVIVAGIHRPGEMCRACEGISAKVLNERLRKLERFQVVERTVFPEVPPRVEYHLTAFGRRFIPLVDAVGTLQRELACQVREPEGEGT